MKFRSARYLILIVTLLPFIIGGCGGGGGGGSSKKECGGTTGKVCEATEFCDYADLSCGAAGTPGECKEIPVGDCNLPTAPGITIAGPTCSCDGLSFFNECWSSQAGQTLRGFGDC